MLKVFISYASEDRERVEPYFDEFSKMEGVSPWMDVRSILPGQDWEYEISRAFEAADVVAIFMSSRSVSKVGYVQREARDAVRKAEYAPEGHISVIPLLLEDCEVPRLIRGTFQYVDLRLPTAWPQVIASIQLAMAQRAYAEQRGAVFGPFIVHEENIKRSVENRYELDLTYPRIESTQLPKVAAALTQIFEQDANRRLQEVERDEEGRFNEQVVNFAVANATPSLFCIQVSEWGYWEGAAHGNIGFTTKNYDIRGGGIREVSLEEIFLDARSAAKKLSEMCRDHLKRETWVWAHDSDNRESAHRWIDEGTVDEYGSFDTFLIETDGLRIVFAPYEVSSYAEGVREVKVFYYDIQELLTPDALTLIRSR